jgi:hypothetical protein
VGGRPNCPLCCDFGRIETTGRTFQCSCPAGQDPKPPSPLIKPKPRPKPKPEAT